VVGGTLDTNREFNVGSKAYLLIPCGGLSMDTIRLLPIIISLLSSPIFAVIPYAAQYCLGNQTCYVLADLHADYKGRALCKKQEQALFTASQKQDLHFIVENMFEYVGNDKEFQEILNNAYQRLQNEQVPLFLNQDLIEYSTLYSFNAQNQQGIHFTNVEFRQAFLVWVQYATQGRSTEALAVFDKLCVAFKEIVQEIGNYNDNEILNEYYQNIVQKRTKDIDQLQQNATKSLTGDARIEFMQQLWRCMISLLDARLVHQWFVHSTSHNAIVLYAGGEHIANVEKMIVKMGYKKIKQLGNANFIHFFKQHRTKIIEAQYDQVPVTGFFASIVETFKYMLANYRIQSLNNASFEEYKKIIAQADEIDLEAFFAAQ